MNEAFAPVPLAWLAELGGDPARLNPRGGAIALGHPLGASGIRLMATMLNHLEATGGRYGLQTMCEAGGMANATSSSSCDRAAPVDGEPYEYSAMRVTTVACRDWVLAMYGDNNVPR